MVSQVRRIHLEPSAALVSALEAGDRGVTVLIARNAHDAEAVKALQAHALELNLLRLEVMCALKHGEEHARIASRFASAIDA